MFRLTSENLKERMCGFVLECMDVFIGLTFFVLGGWSWMCMVEVGREKK